MMNLSFAYFERGSEAVCGALSGDGRQSRAKITIMVIAFE